MELLSGYSEPRATDGSTLRKWILVKCCKILIDRITVIHEGHEGYEESRSTFIFLRNFFFSILALKFMKDLR